MKENVESNEELAEFYENYYKHRTPEQEKEDKSWTEMSAYSLRKIFDQLDTDYETSKLAIQADKECLEQEYEMTAAQMAACYVALVDMADTLPEWLRNWHESYTMLKDLEENPSRHILFDERE